MTSTTQQLVSHLCSRRTSRSSRTNAPKLSGMRVQKHEKQLGSSRELLVQD